MTPVTDLSITLIDNQNYAIEIDQSGIPVLLLCMPQGPDFSDQLIMLQHTAEKYKGVLKVCLLEEELIDGFRQLLHIKGTPVYILFEGGEEKGRILGMADTAQLSTFLSRHIKIRTRAGGNEHGGR